MTTGVGPVGGGSTVSSANRLRPLTVAGVAVEQAGVMQRLRDGGGSAHRCTASTAVYWPPGLRSAITGVAAATTSMSSSVSGTSASRAMASRCKTALVDPPEAAAAATALASEARVMKVRAPWLRPISCDHLLAAAPRHRELLVGGGRHLVGAERRQAHQRHRQRHGVGGELPAAGAGARAGVRAPAARRVVIVELAGGAAPTASKTSWMVSRARASVPVRMVRRRAPAPAGSCRAMAMAAAGMVLSQP